MNSTIKKIIVIFTILCALFLVVFSVELILINRNQEEGDSGPAISGGAQPEDGENGEEPGTTGGDQPGAAAGNGTSAPAGGTPPVPAGTRHDRMMPDDMELVFYVEEGQFEHTMSEQEDVIDYFSYRGAGAAGLEIRFVFMPHGVSAFANTFLEIDYGAQEITTGGEETIRRSRLRGYFASGTRDGTTYEAWIYTGFEDMGLAFIINYEDQAQRNALNVILDTLEMN